jgi:erythromycin esterase
MLKDLVLSRTFAMLILPATALLFASCKAGKSHIASLTDENISAIRSVDPADTNFDDLKAFRSAIGNARVVLLGEQTHGEGATFLAKSRLIRFLHETMGFDVLAFESGLYDMTRIWENTKNGGQLKDEVKGSLFYMYATSKQMEPLFSYLQSSLKSAKPITIAGFESQHSGLNAKNRLFTDFGDFLQSFFPAALDSSWETFKKVSISTFSNRSYRPTEADRNTFFSKLHSLKAALAPHQNEAVDQLLQSPGFWYRIVASIESQALRYWEMVQGNEVSVRDKQMAENLIWLAEHAYPGKKIIVWAHNVHVAKQTASLSFNPGNTAQAFFSSLVPMGHTVHAHFGEKAYHIGFTSSEGSYQDFNNDSFINIPAPPEGSVEARLNDTKHANAFADLRRSKGWWQQPQTAMLYDFMPAKGEWPTVYDGFFFIRKNYPVDR